MVELLEQAVRLTAHPLVLAHPEDLGDLVGGEAEHPQLAGALKNLVDGEMAAEDEMAAVLDLVQRIIAPQVDGCPVLRGELGCHDPGPVVQALAKDVGAEAIGSGL